LLSNEDELILNKISGTKFGEEYKNNFYKENVIYVKEEKENVKFYKKTDLNNVETLLLSKKEFKNKKIKFSITDIKKSFEEILNMLEKNDFIKKSDHTLFVFFSFLLSYIVKIDTNEFSIVELLKTNKPKILGYEATPCS
jgi:hypothetical protein